MPAGIPSRAAHDDRLRTARTARGWSQTELADRAGVSRQLVGGVESGRHAPSVAAAIAIARALSATVEDLFGEPTTDVTLLGRTPVPTNGERAVHLARVGDRLVAVAPHDGVESAEQWTTADALVAGDGALTMLPHGSAEAFLVAGCDPALGVLAGLVHRTAGERVLVAHASTTVAADALADGNVHAAVVHATAQSMPAPPIPVERWHLARWQVGLASARRGGVPTIDEIATRRVQVVQRAAGASTQMALDRALTRAGAPRATGPIGAGHIDVARRVAAGAPVGVTMEAAACSFDLGFTPLEVHEVEVWIDARWSATAAARAIVDLLAGDALRSRLQAIGGYDLSMCGRRIA